jgi:hypothetical protein
VNESGATRALNDKLPSAGLLIWKVADQFTNGVPDCYYAGHNGQSLWIEYKLKKWKLPPKSINVSPKNKVSGRLSAKQQDWLNKHHERGHNVAVVMIHYRPRNAEYYVFRDRQWDTPQESKYLLHFNQQDYVEWILTQMRITTNEQAAAR